MKYHKDVYEVTVDLQIRAKITTQANSESEAYENIQNDLDKSSTSEILDNYDWEIRETELDYAELKDKPW